jgi:hypothetical protein
MTRLFGLSALLVALGTSAQAQAPTRENAAALLKDAMAERAAAAKALEVSEVYQRYERSKRLVEGLTALAKADEAKKAEAKAEAKPEAK